MKRQIIKIDEQKCTGCGLCVPNCAEGAIQLIDGKARLISDLLCDGLGACIGHCPEGAITIEEREAEPYDERRVMDGIIKGGPKVIAAHLKHLQDHQQTAYYEQALQVLRERGIPVPASAAPVGGHAGCPGLRMADRTRTAEPAAGPGAPPPATTASAASAPAAQSALRQWPVQLRLLQPHAAFFDNADLLIAADCVPFAMADFHAQLLAGRVLIVFCPKLDADLGQYVEKLAAIFRAHTIRSITVAHMEVPCCGGVGRVVAAAQQAAGSHIPVTDVTITLQGERHG